MTKKKLTLEEVKKLVIADMTKMFEKSLERVKKAKTAHSLECATDDSYISNKAQNAVYALYDQENSK